MLIKMNAEAGTIEQLPTGLIFKVKNFFNSGLLSGCLRRNA
ncbi:hypothetical protein ACPOL_0767 [Acidisarcina polymorpha]|uniref:Uncharacterized protein n=1 Tax=Acidisarcina polymorpha TaxID=2211140 RepID=A0A2Z5FTH6_9BACT|nr:hypothetical protein ACPOL_0767 [Acidisarcina polymorpha]